MKEIILGTSKRLLIVKHPSAQILEIDVQQQSALSNIWITRTSMSLSAEILREMLKQCEGT